MLGLPWLHREKLCRNILITGGSSLISGLATRLQNELSSLLPAGACNPPQGSDERSELFSTFCRTDLPARVSAVQGGQDSAWVGASIVSQMPMLLNHCISLDNYNEYGTNLVFPYRHHTYQPNRPTKQGPVSPLPGQICPGLLYDIATQTRSYGRLGVVMIVGYGHTAQKAPLPIRTGSYLVAFGQQKGGQCGRTMRRRQKIRKRQKDTAKLSCTRQR
jgi:hypothetical protein